MDLLENHFSDLIEHSEGIKILEERLNLFYERADMVEKRKKAVFDHSNTLESNSIVIPDSVFDLNDALIVQVEKRKKLSVIWKTLIKQRDLLTEKSIALDKLLLNNNKLQLSPAQSMKFELLFAQHEQILKKQNELLSKRESMLAEEERLISEIERILNSLD